MFEPGSRIAGRYTIERVLGQGGMGSVYLASDEKFGARVAVKVASATGASYARFRARFVREARIGNRLGKERGCVRALDWGELDDHTLFLAMDLVEGARSLDLVTGTLDARLEKLAAAARLVALAHSQGVIHRDVKPQNFLEDERGAIWLADFGLAKVRGETEDDASPEDAADLTRPGTSMGTPWFMPPEQFRDASNVDERADVYALGALLFLALTGKPPFEGRTPGEILLKQEHARQGLEPVPAPRARARDVPLALDALCVRAIALDPAERLASARELVLGIETYQASANLRLQPTGLDSHPSHELAPVPVAAPAPRRRSTGLARAVAAAAVLALGAAALGAAALAWRAPPPDERAAAFEPVLATCRQGIYAVLSRRPGAAYELHATAFAINDRLALLGTNGHVSAPVQAWLAEGREVIVRCNANERATYRVVRAVTHPTFALADGAGVGARSPDVGILEVEKNALVPMPCTLRPASAASLAALAPGGLVAVLGFRDAAVARLVPGVVGALTDFEGHPMDGGGFEMIEQAGTIDAGSTGAPILDLEGSVVALVNAMPGAGLTYGVSSRHLVELARKEYGADAWK
jgi:hypothetical protein